MTESSAARPGRILVVEDDDAILFTITEILSVEGYDVETARNGREALDLIRKERPPQLILLDMKMPVMDGWEFASEFYARYDHLAPIIVMTAAEDAAKRAAEIHVDGWLGKPFSLEALRSAVAAHLK